MSEDLIFTVYGRPGCGYCSAAVSILQRADLAFEYIDVYQAQLDKTDVSERIGQPVYTWPQISHGEQYVGGYTELVTYLRR